MRKDKSNILYKLAVTVVAFLIVTCLIAYIGIGMNRQMSSARPSDDSMILCPQLLSRARHIFRIISF